MNSLANLLDDLLLCEFNDLIIVVSCGVQTQKLF